MSSAEQPLSHNIDEGEKSLLPLVMIIGPTAVGKTEISVRLAERFDGEIISADSRLFYRGMDIGTAKPSLKDRSRIRHHLIDTADPDETWSLGVFQKEVNRAVTEIYNRHHLPFLVGGTGQFIRSIIEGWGIPRVEPNPHLRNVLTQWGNVIGPIGLHGRLAILDLPAANSIDPTNERRTIRALEVIFSTGRRFSDQRVEGRLLYNPLVLGMNCPRSELYKRIDERISKMMEAGFVEEVKRLLELGYSPELPTLSAIGYGEIVSFLQGKITIEEAIRLMKRRTRIFVRRQANWFRENDPRIHWFQSGSSTFDEMVKTIEKWLLSIHWNSYPG